MDIIECSLKRQGAENGIQKWKSLTSVVFPLSNVLKYLKDMCSASDATDSKRRCGEWVGTQVGTEQLTKIVSVSRVRVEIQAGDISDITTYPSPMYHMLKSKDSSGI